MSSLIEMPDTISSKIDAWWEENKTSSPRSHLGCSLLGHPCDRYLWLSFRWAISEHFNGRMLRLFDRGQCEEARIVENLRRIGIVIHHTAADDDGQVSVHLAPHISGSVDGIIESGVPGAEKTRHIAEFKTYNKKYFDELRTKGVYNAKRRHWCQMQCYMLGTNINSALYVAVCKDDDRIYTERVDYNETAAKSLVERGRRIVFSEPLPPMGFMDAHSEPCLWCAAKKFCYETHMIEPSCINCRTCAHITPCLADNSTEEANMRKLAAAGIEISAKEPEYERGAWRCEAVPLFNLRSFEDMSGCPRHVLHPQLVPWKAVGGDDDRGIFEIDGAKVLNGAGADAIPSVDLLNGVRNAETLADIPF